MFVLLDTTVLIDFLRGRPAKLAVRRIKQTGDVACTTAINVEEVARGLFPAEQAAGRALFGGLQIIPLGRKEGWQAGIWRRAYAAQGLTLSQADCLIASAALSSGAKLATGNPNHFPMPDVTVEHWPVSR